MEPKIEDQIKLMEIDQEIFSAKIDCRIATQAVTAARRRVAELEDERWKIARKLGQFY